MQVIRIEAEWDNEASVWVATSDDIPLVAEAPTLEVLEARPPGLLQDLIDGSGPEVEILSRSSRIVKAGSGCAAAPHEQSDAPLKGTVEQGRMLLRAAGTGRDHEIWQSPITGRRFPVDNAIKSRHTANAVLRQAGLAKAF